MKTLRVISTFSFILLWTPSLFAHANIVAEPTVEPKLIADEKQLPSIGSTTHLKANTTNLKIVSLAPHLTEWVFSLGLGSYLVGVSDYSDYPEAAKNIQRVADFQGADIAAIVALEPDLILAWDGGNKPQDIHKLSSMGLNVFTSKVGNITDIASEIKRLGALTNTQKKATQLTNDFLSGLKNLRQKYDTEPRIPVFYYSWTAPLMTIGPNAWGNKLLNVCGAQTLFHDSPIDYPQVAVKDVLVRQPHALIAASKSSHEELEVFWRAHRGFLDAPLIVVDPDVTSRFSLRLINELKSLCEGIK
ncbi:cobalamin-binding protein [Alteromonas sp. BL110]|nr:cobalamin-binding protein [Alteromonas sp. BL110]RKM82156.1 cobalamin-binding protein [Alteromonas sp. BL110]